MAEAHTPSLAARLADSLTGEYTIEGEIGRGGMGVVFLARDLKLKRRVAIKVLPPDLAYRPEIRTRFTREAQTAARLSHPHIVPIHAVGEADGLVYFVMGFVDGEPLGARLKRRGKLPIEEVRRIMKETSDALGMAHTMGIIHRDIKPDNILLDGTRRRVMVTDFGIAKALSDVGTGTLTGTGVALGGHDGLDGLAHELLAAPTVGAHRLLVAVDYVPVEILNQDRIRGAGEDRGRAA